MSDKTIVPSNSKKILACKGCGLLKTYEQFLERGCDNCDDEIRLQGSRANIEEWTTPHFEGHAHILILFFFLLHFFWGIFIF